MGINQLEAFEQNRVHGHFPLCRKCSLINEDTSNLSSAMLPDSAFLRLPREIRLEIFKYTDLVDLRQSSLEDHAILYEAGALRPGHHAVERGKLAGQSCTSAISCSWPLSRSLFLVNKQIYNEAREVFFEHHRFVLAAGHNANLEWLHSLPDNCRRRIRRLHIRFKAERHDLYKQYMGIEDEFDPEREAIISRAESIEDDDFEDPGGNESGCCLICNISGWDALLAHISTQLNLAKLHLAVDLGHIYQQGRTTNSYAPISAAITKRAIHRVSRPLITQLRGRIKSLFIFLPVHFELESSIEESVKGTEYNAVQSGKIPSKLRCYWRPYAMPNSHLGRVTDPPRPPLIFEDLWARAPRPKLWGMADAAQGVIRISHVNDFYRGYSARRTIDLLESLCTTRETCDEKIELVIRFRLPTGEIIIKEF